MKALLFKVYESTQKVAWICVVPLLRRVMATMDQISLTCDRTDGGGAQIHGRISTIAFSRRFGINYLHSPMTSVDYASETDLRKWNQVFDFPRLFEDAETVLSSGGVKVRVESLTALISKILALYVRKYSGSTQFVFEIPHCHRFTNLFPSLIQDLRQELKAYAGDTLSTGHGSKCTGAIIHVRGSIGGVGDDSPRRSSFCVIGEKISQAKATGEQVTIYSSEHDARLETVGALDTEVDSSSDVFQVLRCIAQAEHFFMAKSSLSYVGALICEGKVHYESFWHPRLSDWQQFPN